MLKLLKKIVLFFLFVNLNFCLIANKYIGSGILPYCVKPDGKVYFLFAKDNKSKNKTWGDLGGKFCSSFLKSQDIILMRLAAEYAHMGSYGIFSQTQDDFVAKKDLGLDFFLEQLDQENLLRINSHDRYYDLFFVKVDYYNPSFFTNYIDYLKTSRNLNENFFRFIGFAWVSAESLLEAIQMPGYLLLNSQDISVCGQETPVSIIVNKYLAQDLKSNINLIGRIAGKS